MKAVCVLTNTSKTVKGYIEFSEIQDYILITVNITGLTEGYHGIHIHEYGDLRENCKSVCSHFNPYNTLHGDIGDSKNNRHIGDLGNIYANEEGNVNITFKDYFIKFKGKCNIIGRSVVIHEKEDDLGRGGIDYLGNIINEKIYNESIKTGNAGSRIACGVIGWCK